MEYIPDKPTTQALIRVSDLDNSPFDISDAYFMIKSPQTNLNGEVKYYPLGLNYIAMDLSGNAGCFSRL